MSAPTDGDLLVPPGKGDPKRLMSKSEKNVDPLYQLFEHNLLNRSYEDTNAFLREVAEEYLAYLDSTPAHVPFHIRASLLKDLESEAHEMLVKKMYGCAQEAEYTNQGSVKLLSDEQPLEQLAKKSSTEKTR